MQIEKRSGFKINYSPCKSITQNRHNQCIKLHKYYVHKCHYIKWLSKEASRLHQNFGAIFHLEQAGGNLTFKKTRFLGSFGLEIYIKDEKDQTASY